MSDEEHKTADRQIRETAPAYSVPAKTELTEEEARLRQREKNQAAIELLRSWRECSEEEAQEQRETFEYLKRVLDEDRPSYRKLFP